MDQNAGKINIHYHELKSFTDDVWNKKEYVVRHVDRLVSSYNIKVEIRNDTASTTWNTLFLPMTCLQSAKMCSTSVNCWQSETLKNADALLR